MSISSVKIVGSGLIGTSIGLALSAQGVRVLMTDKDPAASALAQSLVGSHPQTKSPEVFDVVVLAVPPSSFKKVIEEESKLHPSSTFVDILSIKTKPLLEVQGYADVASRFVGTHPMAGREISGAQSARGDLFVGRTWIITTGESTQSQSADLAAELIALCGGVSVFMSAQDHDRAMALISHAPQMLASVLAAQLIDVNPQWLTLIGQGFRDFTRIADSDPLLWREILSENSENILPVLRNFRRRLEEVESTLNDPLVAQSVIELGNQGRKLIPGKHGKTARTYIYLHIVIDDKAGQLASIFNDCASADVNIEDVSIEHTPGQNTGLVTLSILEMAKAEHLEHFLSDHGWKVHLTRK
jgi:prephenate dehydrogenase